jgi:signal peptidase I
MTKSMQSIFHAQIVAGLKNNCPIRFKVTGNCMKPLIQKGDWVLIEPIIAEVGLQVGEIVLIDRGVDFVVHRLIRINESEILTHGDWSRFPDPPVKFEQILGYVVEIEKNGYKFRLNNPFVRIINRINNFISSLYRKFYSNKGVNYETFNHSSSK